jgi:hypothetical protein
MGAPKLTALNRKFEINGSVNIDGPYFLKIFQQREAIILNSSFSCCGGTFVKKTMNSLSYLGSNKLREKRVI